MLQSKLDAQLITEEEFLQAKLAAAQEYDAAKKKIDEDEIKRQQAKEQLIQDAAGGTLSILSNLNEAFANKSEKNAKKAFENNKKIQIAETLISTYFAAQKAYTSQIIPGDPSSPVRATIAAAVAVAAGLAKVAKIVASNTEA